MREIIKYSILFLLLLLAQVFVFNKIFVFQFAVPVVFFYIILVMPLLPVWIYLPVVFFMGVMIDSFTYTPGMYTAPCVLLAYIRTPLVQYIKKLKEDELISFHSSFIGLGSFMLFVFCMSLVFHLYFSFLSAFTFSNFLLTLLRVVMNTLLSTIFIMLIEILFFYRRQTTATKQVKKQV